jgi:hypothetical protein
MASLPRRRFVLELAALLPVPFVARRMHRLAVDDLDPQQLRALGSAILPRELGTDGVNRVVSGFEHWLAGYREGVELVHGYGTGELRRTGPSPALRWSAQLRELDAVARKQGHRFQQLSLDDRQTLVRSALEGQRGAGLPPIDRAGHVAVGLLAFFYASPEATDLCYQARIGGNGCRPLAESPHRPLPLARRG